MGNDSGERPGALKDSTFSGVRWSGGAHVLKQVLRFGIGIVLVRLLSPEPFGVIGMAAVVTGFMSLVSNLGFGPALVQREDLREGHVTGVFWASLGLGVLLAVLAVASAPIVSGFFGEPAVEPVLASLSAVFVLGAVTAAPKSLLQRQMDFESLAKLEIPALVIGGAAAIGLAWAGAGVWSLVTRRLATPVLEAALVWGFVAWRPSLRFPTQAVRELAGYSLNLTGFNLVNYWARRADDLLIGRIMGSASLGLYNRAYQLMLLPISQIIGAISRVIFPALSSLQGDLARMRRMYLRVVRVVSMIAFPIMAGLAVLTDAFVIGVLGEQWTGAIRVIRILCLVGMIQTLANPTGWIYKATGRTDWMMWWGVGGGGVLIASIVVGVWLGSIETVAWAYAGGNLLLLYPVIAIPGSLIDMTFSDVTSAVGPGAIAAGIMAAVLLAVRHWFLPDWSAVALLSLLVPLGVVVYLGASLWLNRTGCREFLRAVEGVSPQWESRIETLRGYL